MKTLDDLFDGTYEDATFHDAQLLSLHFDFACASAVIEFDIQCRASAPGEQFSLQRGKLRFSGLCFYWIEPSILAARPADGSSLWITAEGPLPDERMEISRIMPDELPAGAFVHYLYSSSSNGFIVIGASEVQFKWSV